MKRTIYGTALLASVAAGAGITFGGAAGATPWSWFSALTGQDSTPSIAAPNGGSNISPQGQIAVKGRRLADGQYVGRTEDAYYGLVQVKATIRGGRLVAVDVLKYPADRRTSRYINAQALPMLETEVIRAQSSNVNAISGATLTSVAYLRSMSSALVKAGAGA